MKARRIHPCPPASPVVDRLSLLPAAVLTLAAALTAEEQEVLAYLLSSGSCGGGVKKERKRAKKTERQRPHKPELGCQCFGCYKSFWARWDASPNRQLIHHILDAFEETLEAKERAHAMKSMRRRHKRKGGGGRRNEEEVVDEEEAMVNGDDVADDDDDDGHGHGHDDYADDDDDDDDDDDGDREVGDGGKSSVRRLMSFIGERVWGVWN